MTVSNSTSCGGNHDTGNDNITRCTGVFRITTNNIPVLSWSPTLKRTHLIVNRKMQNLLLHGMQK